MKKKSCSISINILSAFVIMLSLFLAIIQPTNAWFSDSLKNGVLIQIDVGDLKLKVYQDNTSSENNEIYDNTLNSKKGEDASYVYLAQEIVPDQNVPLTLILANKDTGSASMYVRFQFHVYTRGVESDDELEDVTIVGLTTNSKNGNKFVENVDGWYYYQNTSSENALFAKGEEATMMTGFKISINEFVDSSGNLLIKNSETIYFKLIVNASVSKTFSV